MRHFAVVWLVGGILLLSLSAASRPAAAAPALLFDVATGEVYHAHEALRQWHPASLTKIMTTYVALRALRERRVALDTPLVFSARAAAQPPSKIGLKEGQQVQLGTALQILMVKSANDVAVAVAEGIFGSVEAFVAQMNREAQRLGMRSTRFVNPHGLHDANQITTARDMAVLARAILRDFPSFNYIYQMRRVSAFGANLRSHNTLLGRYDGADGLKTGFVCASGFNIVATATRNGRRLGVVIMGSPNANLRHDYATHLLDTGFDQPTGFLFFTTGSTTSLDELGRSVGARGPANMRPYVCGPRSQRQPVPPELASYGVRLPDATVIEDPQLPVTARASIPMPRPNPRREAGTVAAAPAIDPRYPLAPEIPLPRPRPLR